MRDTLSVREISFGDIELLADYWTESDPAFLISMGVDLEKIPARADLVEMLLQQLSHPHEEKKSYAIIWLVDGYPAGHSNINKIIFGEEAYLHLHIWKSMNRKRGLGLQFLGMTFPYFFQNFKIKRLISEPYALNPAPNNTLSKAGFEFIKRYRTIPGSLNFEQEVNQWELTFEKFVTIKQS